MIARRDGLDQIDVVPDGLIDDRPDMRIGEKVDPDPEVAAHLPGELALVVRLEPRHDACGLRSARLHGREHGRVIGDGVDGAADGFVVGLGRRDAVLKLAHHGIEEHAAK